MVDKITSLRELFKHHGDDTPYFSLSGLKTHARVIDIYDGDTMTIILDVNGFFLKFKCRVTDIDTCELHSKNNINKQLAILARNRLFELVTGMKLENQDSTHKNIKSYLEDNVYLVWVHCLEFDKYGRILIECFSSDKETKSFAKVLLDEQLAYPYNGDTKLTEQQQLQVLKK